MDTTINELDTTPDHVTLAKDIQFTMDEVPFAVHIYYGEDGHKCLTLSTASFPRVDPKKFNMHHQHQTTFGLKEAKALIKLLQHSVDYLDKAEFYKK